MDLAVLELIWVQNLTSARRFFIFKGLAPGKEFEPQFITKNAIGSLGLAPANGVKSKAQSSKSHPAVCPQQLGMSQAGPPEQTL
jgi:hypothetical protein